MSQAHSVRHRETGSEGFVVTWQPPQTGRDGALRRPRRRAQRQATERTPTTSACLFHPYRAGTAQRTVPTAPTLPGLRQPTPTVLK